MTALNQAKIDLTLKDVLDLLKKDIMLTLNCHAIGTVRSFDSARQTIEASINYVKEYQKLNADGSTGTFTANYPVLVDVPVLVLQGGSGALTMPIQAGDTCLILFNDRGLDTWLHSGQVRTTTPQRFHAMSDGIAFVGLRPFTNPIASYDADRTVLRFGTGVRIAAGSAGAALENGSDVMVRAGASKIRLKNATTDLLTVLSNLNTALETFATACVSATTFGQINAAGTALNTAIIAVQVKVGALLE